ncbi:GAP family protein [Microbacterium sp. Se5.02b]|uniref:GAP family protein n=1 Tax=Microbacterium sp. Se5.02b TaxID=2864103 RepID=UPI001C68C6A1|nr:GAP family protein [Microbacterium sp. Se5.02b]QYM65629.1 GAP family protein [Microbacterium sp. Se5.02b]
MGELILDLVPVALGVVLSPLAIMALVAVLLSGRARTNGIAYLLGWLLGLGGLLAFFLWLFPQLAIRERNEPPLWVPVVRLLIGAFLVCAAVWVYRKGHAHVEQMAAASSPRDVVAASPQLPGWLHSVESFRPGRTFLLGVGLFVLNPVDASCAILAALDISQSEVGGTAGTVVAIVFVVVGTLPVAAPVLYVIIRGADAQPALDRVRTWIAGNSHVLNAALLLVIGALQLEKAIAALL